MNMKAKIMAVAAAAAVASSAFAGAKTGSWLGSAKQISVGKSVAVTLVAEYDPDADKGDKYDTGSGVYWYKVKLSRGSAYTFWINGGNAVDLSFDIDTNPDADDDKVASASFDVETVQGGKTQAAYMYADDWDFEEDPKTCWYYVCIMGDVGQRTTLYSTAGTKSFTSAGEEDSPKAVTFSTAWKSNSGKLIEGNYWFRATLKAGCMYRVRTWKGAKNKELDLSWESDDSPLFDYEDPDYTNPSNKTVNANFDYNTATVIVPTETKTYRFCVSGVGQSSTDTQAFQFYYKQVAAKKIADHKAFTLSRDNAWTAQFVPGRMSTSMNYYDSIIDEQLCVISLAKGDRVVFDGTGADRTVRMIAYDSKGKILAENETVGNGSRDVRCGIEATSAGKYYVGIYDPDLLYTTDKPQCTKMTLTARWADDFPAADGFDPADNTYAGASLLDAYPVNTTNDFDAALAGSKHGPHMLDSGDWYDVFALNCRKGYKYYIAASLDESDDSTNDLTLDCDVFTVVNGKEVKQKSRLAYSVVGDQAETNLFYGAVLTPATNAVHYLRVYVKGGKGLDFPNYYMHAAVAYNNTKFGLVRVEATGALGSFSYGTEKMSYPVGTSLAVPYGTRTFTYRAPAGFKGSPATGSASVKAWSEYKEGRDASKEPVSVLTAKFTDIYETTYTYYTTKKTTKTVNGKKKTVTTKVAHTSPATGDNTPAGAFPLEPAKTVQRAARSLYAEDKVDYFKIDAPEGYCYDLWLENFAVGGATGAVMAVSNSGGTVAKNAVSLMKTPLPKGANTIAVTHGAGFEAKDSSYSLAYASKFVGVVKFSSANFTAKESDEYAVLTLKRTGTEGSVSVGYTTVAGTAKPGEEYYPTNAVVTWADGDNSDRTVKVRLIPDLVPTVEANRNFSVKIWPIEKGDLAEDEYPAMVAQDTAKVTIGETDTKKPGTVAVTGCSNSAAGVFTPVSNEAKPAVSGVAGEPLVIRLSRKDGSNGRIAVKLTTPVVKGDTAKAGTDFKNLSTTVEWADGDAADKFVTVATMATKYASSAKKFTVKLAVAAAGAKPALAAAAVTAKLSSAQFEEALDAGGVALSTVGSWFVDTGSGAFRSSTDNSSVLCTLTGPGFFAVEPSINNGGSPAATTGRITVQFGTVNAKTKAFTATETVTMNAATAARVARIIPSGSRGVKIAFTGGNKFEYLEFKEMFEGMPFKWVPFSSVMAANPMDKAVVAPGKVQKLAWKIPSALAGENIYVKAFVGKTAKPDVQIGNPAVDASSVEVPEEYSELASGKKLYWRVSFALAEGIDASSYKWTDHPSVWSVSAAAAGTPETIVYDGSDPWGESIQTLVNDGETIRLIQGLKLSARLKGAGAATANRYRLAGGKLPPGITINATSGKLEGAPTKTGEYMALLQSYWQKDNTAKSAAAAKYGTTVGLSFSVEPIGLAAGTFRGVLAEEGGAVSKKSAGTAFVTFSATSAGALSATVKVAGNTYKFTDWKNGKKGYDELESDEPAAEGLNREFSVELRNITTISKKSGTKTVKTQYTNTLEVAVGDAPVGNTVALGQLAGTAKLTLNVPNGLLAKATGVQRNIKYGGDLYRACSATDAGKTAAGLFAGYYTVALVPTGITATDGIPFGNGYLTATLANTGALTFAGTLADGTAVSGSSAVSVQGADVTAPDDPAKCELAAPVHWSDATSSISGVLRFLWAEDDDGNPAAVFDSGSSLYWNRDASAATSRDKSAFSIEASPAGGWYNKTWRVQRYYLDCDLAAYTVGEEDLPYDALASGYTFKVNSTPNNLEVRLAGNKTKVPAKSLVKESSTLLYDLEKSINPWSTTINYTRATGLVSGTFTAWSETPAATKQMQIQKIPHKGVMLFNRDAAAPVDDNVWSAGYFLMPTLKNKSWQASLPFNIIATPVDGGRDWNEEAPGGQD